VGSNQRL